MLFFGVCFFLYFFKVSAGNSFNIFLKKWKHWPRTFENDNDAKKCMASTF